MLVSTEIWLLCLASTVQNLESCCSYGLEVQVLSLLALSIGSGQSISALRLYHSAQKVSAEVLMFHPKLMWRFKWTLMVLRGGT